jgi:hypothetical protein
MGRRSWSGVRKHKPPFGIAVAHGAKAGGAGTGTGTEGEVVGKGRDSDSDSNFEEESAGAILKMSRAALDATVGLVVDDLAGASRPSASPHMRDKRHEDDEESEKDELED